jgi:hypothetical protein
VLSRSVVGIEMMGGVHFYVVLYSFFRQFIFGTFPLTKISIVAIYPRTHEKYSRNTCYEQTLWPLKKEKHTSFVWRYTHGKRRTLPVVNKIHTLVGVTFWFLLHYIFVQKNCVAIWFMYMIAQRPFQNGRSNSSS